MSQFSKTRVCALVCLLLALTIPAYSQTAFTGAISVRAQDSSGAVIPGVEVAISSPQMIGGARTGITDEQGTFRFTELVSGTYRVTFSLPGFKTLNLDGNVVAAGRTLTVPGTLEVATVAEEITVTSAAPTIDLEASTVAVNWDQNKLDNLPYSRSLAGLTTMIPGLFQTSYDVGGSSFGTGSGVSARTYGRSGNNAVVIDGLVWDQGYADWGAFEEINVITASKGADQMNAGVTVNQVLKSGSNQWHWGLNQDLEKGSFQGTNFDDYLRGLGASLGSNKFTTLRETYGEISGPVLKDKFWFYWSYRDSYGGYLIPGFIRLSDGQQQEFYTKLESPTAKLTYQLTDNMKIDTSWQLGRKWQPYRAAGQYTPLEGSQNQDSWSTFGPNFKWTYIVGPKMTATAGINRGGYWWPDYPWTTGCNPSTPCTNPNELRRTDINSSASGSTGPILSIYRRPIRWTWNGDVAWFNEIGGKNNELKFGYFAWWDKSYTSNFGYPNQQVYRYQSTAAQAAAVTGNDPQALLARFATANANSVVVYDYPNKVASGGRNTAFYIDDKITWNRKLTVKMGARIERFSSFLPEQGNTGEGLFAVRDIFPERHDFPVYNSIVPRLSFTYDVTGTGRLALKASYGRYISSSSSPSSQPGPGASNVNPNRTKECRFNGWRGEIPFVPIPGQTYTSVSNCSNGSWDAAARKLVANVFTTRLAGLDLNQAYLDEWTTGLEIGFNRDYSMRFNVVRKFDFPGTRTVSMSEPFEAYTDVRSYVDPGSNGSCGSLTSCQTGTGQRVYVWSVPTSYPTQGKVDDVIQNLRSGEGKDQYTAYEVTFNKAHSNRWSALASFTVDMAHESDNDSLTPTDLWYRFDAPYWRQASKVNGQYELPWGFMWAGTYTAQSGAWYDRTLQVRNALNTNVTLSVERRVGRYPWVHLWDNRISKKFTIADRHVIEGTFDLFNTLNVNTVTSWNQASGSTYHRPSEWITPRIFKLGIRYKF
ncbi:MAG: TonB-dependent receptor [Acidobacteria bacterium]|nr:TonB-dependent receptor [Acidobacteriota bacterium]